MAGAPRRLAWLRRCRRDPFRTSPRCHAPVPLKRVGGGSADWSVPARFSATGARDLPTTPATVARSGLKFQPTRPAASPTSSSQRRRVLCPHSNVARASCARSKTDERTKLLEAYRAQRREVRRGRLGHSAPRTPMSAHDLWDSNRPGSTLISAVMRSARVR